MDIVLGTVGQVAAAQAAIDLPLALQHHVNLLAADAVVARIDAALRRGERRHGRNAHAVVGSWRELVAGGIR